jgi:branched-chain amino acid transport system permease protein
VGSVEIIGGVELYYYVVLVLVVASYLLARQLMQAPFGSVLQSIRESEQRTEFIGYDVTAYKRRAFVVSGGLAALAGGLAAVSTGGVAPAFLAWIKSGEVIVMTILGGMGTLYGPMVGAGVFFVAKEILLGFTEQWQGILGVLFVLFVIFVPRGLVSVPGLLEDRFGGRTRGPDVVADDDVEVTD